MTKSRPGNMARNAAPARKFQRTTTSSTIIVAPTGTVIAFGDSVITSAMRNSRQENRNVRMATAAIPGFAMGRMTSLNVWNFVAPST